MKIKTSEPIKEKTVKASAAVAIFHFDHPEAKSTVCCERNAYGLSITIDKNNGEPPLHAIIDLFYTATKNGNPLFRTFDSDGNLQETFAISARS